MHEAYQNPIQNHAHRMTSCLFC